MRMTAYMINPSRNLKGGILHILINGFVDRFCSTLTAFADIVLDFFWFCLERIRVSRFNNVYGFISIAIGSIDKRSKTNLKWFGVFVCG